MLHQTDPESSTIMDDNKVPAENMIHHNNELVSQSSIFTLRREKLENNTQRKIKIINIRYPSSIIQHD